jgi:hypothetical protein
MKFLLDSNTSKKTLNMISLTGMAVVLALFFSGCASMSTMQTARTTNKGEFGGGGGMGYVNTKIPLGTDTAGNTTSINLKAPFMEGSARYGITDNLDLGVKLTIIGTATMDAKYQFIGDKTSLFAASAGFGLGYLSISSGDSKSNVYDIMVPFYASVHPAEWFAVYVSPKYVLRLNSYTENAKSGFSNSHWYGGTGGLKFGKKTSFMIEYSYFRNSAMSEVPFSQVTAGLTFNIN